MSALLEILILLAIAFNIILILSMMCATIWACITWLFNREWEWTDKFLTMLEFWYNILSGLNTSAVRRRRHRSSINGFKGGSSRGGGAGRSF